MSLPVLRSLSARIVFGFAILIITFGAFAVSTMHNMGRLREDITAIRVGYLELALTAYDLQATQARIRAYLFDDIERIRSVQGMRGDIVGFRAMRSQALAKSARALTRLRDLPHGHHTRVADIESRLAVLHGWNKTIDPLYKRLVANTSADVSDIVTKLRDAEATIFALANEFKEYQELVLEGTATQLQKDEQRLRRYTLYWAIAAAIVALIVTAGAAISLRPLKRLRDAAKRIARGDYASRIEEKGPAEIDDLAREFNIMGHAIEERERQLVRSERLVAVGKMAATITHEIRNPLSSLGLNTELLEEELSGLPEQKSCEARNLCKSIHDEVHRLTAITEEYLHFARLPKPKLQLESLNTIVANVASFEKSRMNAQAAKLDIQLAPNLPPAMFDTGQIRQALLNLLRNANEAVQEVGGGLVVVSTKVDESKSYVLCTVSDDGPGIEDELATKIFDPFFSEKQGGTGLGLALTQQIISEHGGTLSVESSPGRGARFTIALPIAAEKSTEAQGPVKDIVG